MLVGTSKIAMIVSIAYPLCNTAPYEVLPFPTPLANYTMNKSVRLLQEAYVVFPVASWFCSGFLPVELLLLLEAVNN